MAYAALRAENGSVIGPSNAFGPGQFAVEAQTHAGPGPLTPARIFNNHFGIDPISMRTNDLQLALRAFRQVEFAGNVVASAVHVNSTGGVYVFNRFVKPETAVVLGSQNQLGPGNVFRGSMHLLRGNQFF